MILNQPPAPKQPDYTLIEEQPLAVSYQLRLSPEIFYFQGHFPVQPVLPGVVQIHWAMAKGLEHFPIKGEFSRMEAIKFQQVIFPERAVTMHLSFDSDKNKLSFRFQDGDTPFSSGRIVYSEQE
tara:strand:- start:4662 stop:5033 length:372 start_codon:yes stop_codon:yes gene_type:complete